MNEIHYHAHNLDELKCDVCDKFLCYGFIDHAFDAGFLCETCKEIKQNEQAPEVAKQETEYQNRLRKEKQCGESTEGHKWRDVTSQCLVMGSYVYSCTKCGGQKTEPMHMSLPLREISSTFINF